MLMSRKVFKWSLSELSTDPPGFWADFGRREEG